MLFFWTFHSSKSPKNVHHNFHKNIKQHNVFSIYLLIRNAPWVLNQHIRVISEGSCDTEDFSNDAENSALHHRNKLHFKYIKTENRFTFFTIFINITVVYCIFLSNKCNVEEHRLPVPSLWRVMISSLKLLDHSFDLAIFLTCNVTLNIPDSHFMCSSSSKPGATNEALD